MKNPLSIAVALAAAAVVVPSAYAQDAQAGAKKIAMCNGCHGIPGYQASFPQVYKVPMIAGQSAKYVVSALNAYKKGDRKHPSMRGIAESLSDQDMADIAAYYEGLGGSVSVPETPAEQPPAPVAELLTKGACASCHGANFSKPIDPTYPKIAGQHADYLFVSLKAYKTEGNPRVGRANAIMGGQVKQFSVAELKLLANYVGSLPSQLKTVRPNPFSPGAH
jgi:cytochrome c553